MQDRDVRPQKKINNVDLNANIEKIEIDSLEASCSNAAKTKLQTRTSIRRNSKMQCPICSKIFDSDKLEVSYRFFFLLILLMIFFYF